MKQSLNYVYLLSFYYNILQFYINSTNYNASELIITSFQEVDEVAVRSSNWNAWKYFTHFYRACNKHSLTSKKIRNRNIFMFLCVYYASQIYCKNVIAMHPMLNEEKFDCAFKIYYNTKFTLMYMENMLTFCVEKSSI